MKSLDVVLVCMLVYVIGPIHVRGLLPRSLRSYSRPEIRLVSVVSEQCRCSSLLFESFVGQILPQVIVQMEGLLRLGRLQ